MAAAAWLAGLMAITFIGVFSKESAVCIVGVIVLYEFVPPESVNDNSRPAGISAGASYRLPRDHASDRRDAVPAIQGIGRVSARGIPFTDNPIVRAQFLDRPSDRVQSDRALSLAQRMAREAFRRLFIFGDSSGARHAQRLGLMDRRPRGDRPLAFAWRWNRIAFFFACFAAITFFPMSNLAFPIGTIMAERFLYLPAIGVMACLVLAIYSIAARFGAKRLAPVAICVIVACFAVRTWARNADWQDESSIVTAGLNVSPDSYKLHKQMAALLFGAERTPANIERGKQEAEKSIALLDSLPDVQNTAEPFCLAAGYDFMEAEIQGGASGGSRDLSPAGIAAYQKGIALIERCAAIDRTVHAAYLAKLKPGMLAPEGDPQPYLMLSAAYLRLNDLDKAVAAVRDALHLYPRSAAGYLQVANVFMQKNLTDDAATALTEGLLLTSGTGLAQAFASISRDAPNSSHCEVIQTASGEMIDPQCAPFRQRVCALAPAVLKARMEVGRPDLAESQRLEFQQKYACSGL